jgi:hypothetical protein
LGIESWGMFIIGYFLFAMASPCFCCCWQYWLLAVGWWMPQRAIAGSPSLLIVSMCHLTFLKNWWVKSMLILWQRNQAYLLEDVDKGSRIARGWWLEARRCWSCRCAILRSWRIDGLNRC